MIAVGLLVALGAATAATFVSSRLQRAGRPLFVPVATMPLGAALGWGAAIVQDADRLGGAITGAVFLPIVAMVVLVVDGRRRGDG